MHWLSEPPATDKASFSTNLCEADTLLAWKVAQSFFSSENREHRVSIVQLTPSVLQNRGLQAAVNLTPEISSALCEGHFRMKTIVIVDPAIDYEIPIRHGNLRINSIGWKTPNPHISFLSGREIDQFRAFGTARLVVIVKSGGGGGMSEFMNILSKGLKSGRFERVLVITDANTSPRDERHLYHTFIRNNVSIIYNQISIDNLFD